MEEISSRCVQLKALPVESTEGLVRKILDQTRWAARYEDVYRHTEKTDDLRWLILFKTREDAELCIQEGQWKVDTRLGMLEVQPDYCSDCIVPLEWRGAAAVGEDWVKVASDETVTGLGVEYEETFDIVHRNRLDSVNSDDLFLSGTRLDTDELFKSGTREDAATQDVNDIDEELREKCNVSIFAKEEAGDETGTETLVSESVRQASCSETNALSSLDKDSWHFSGNVSVKSAELFGSGEFSVSDRQIENEPAQEQGGVAVEKEGSVEIAEPKKTDGGKLESAGEEHTYQNESTTQDTGVEIKSALNFVEKSSTDAMSKNPSYDYAGQVPPGFSGYYPMPMGAGMHNPAMGAGMYNPSMGAGMHNPAMGAGMHNPAMGAGMHNPGYLPVMFGRPPGSVPSSTDQQQFGAPVFYPSMQTPQMYAGQQPMFYMPMMMSAEGKFVPMIPGGVQPSSPSQAAPMSPQHYDVLESHVYDSVGQGPSKGVSSDSGTPYVYMSRHPRQETPSNMKDTTYMKIDDALLSHTQPQPQPQPPSLPPRDILKTATHSVDKDNIKDAGKSAEARAVRPKTTVEEKPKADVPTNRHALKIFGENFESEEEEKQEKDVDGEESIGCRKIKVTGFSRSISKDAVELFFESEKRSGGGDILNMSMKKDEGEAIIEFEEATVVQRILQKQSEVQLVLSGETLHVDLHDPQFDKRKFCITGMAKNTTKESVENFFEARCGHTPVEVIHGETPGTALLIFASEPEFKILHTACIERPLEDTHLDIHEVEVSRSVKVTGCDDRVSTESLTYYFENKRRSQGGDVESVTRQERTGNYIVTFRNVEDAERVCGQEVHFINQTNFSVSLYYPFLDLDSSLLFTLPSPIELKDIEPHLKRFLLGNKSYCDLMEGKVGTSYGHMHWPKMTDDCIKVSCSVDKNDKEGRMKVDNWSNRCLKAVNSVLDQLKVDDTFHIAKEAWAMFKERLGEISIDEPDKVAVYLKKETQGMVVAGETNVVDGICLQARKLAAELEQQLEVEQQTITKARRVKRYQIILLIVARFMDKFRNSQVAIELSHENAEVTFKGTKKDVDDAMDKMFQTINSFAKKQIPGFRKMAIDLLYTQEARRYIKGQLMQKKVTGVWDITKDQKLELYSKTAADVEVAASIFTSCVKQKTIPLDSHMQDIAQKKEWYSTLKKLEEGRENLFKVDVKPGEVYIVGIGPYFEEVLSEIQSMFDLHSIFTDFVEVDAGKFRFMFRHRQKELGDIQKQYQVLAVEIVTVDELNRKGFKVKGTKDGCRLAVGKIKQLSYSILLKDCSLSHPYVNQFINSSDGKDAFRNIEISRSCVLEIAHSRAHSNAPVEPNPLAKCLLGPSKVAVVEGDMTNMLVDAIVNPTNCMLDSNVGLAAAILEKGGSDMQRECGDQRRKVGRLSEGVVVVTCPGRLPCKGVLHLVTPEWLGGKQNEERGLKQAVKTCLEVADKQKYKTLVLPLIGFGKDKFPLRSSVRWLVEALADSLRTAGRFTSLDKIYICDIRSAIVKDIITTMTEVLRDIAQVKLAKEERKSTYGTPMEVDDDDDDNDGLDDDNNDADDYGAVGGRIEPTGGAIQVSVVVGELAKQTVDVIVNSSNQDLNLKVGMVSKGLLRAGGEMLQVECQQNYPRGIQVGELAVTSGGKMACKHVFHGVLVGWDRGSGGSEKVMKHFVEKCLGEADKRKLSSVAFPALGTGVLGYPVDVVAQLMFDTATGYQKKNPSTNLQKVMFVIWQGDKVAIKGFQEVEEREKRMMSKLGSSAMANTFSEKRLRTTNKFKKAFGTLTVEIVQGDITTEMSEVIVNSVLRDLNLNSGNVSKAILAAAGQTIQAECGTLDNKVRMEKEGLVVTSSGKLPYCKKIFHVESKTTESEWMKIVLRCLERADRSGFASISFPALGTGGKGCSPESVTKAMFEAFKQFSQSSTYSSTLKQVRIVIYQAEMVPKFVAAASPLPKSRKSMIPFRSKKPVEQESVTIYVYADSKSCIQKATRDLEDLLSEEERCYGPRTTLRRIESSKGKHLQDYCKKLGIEMSVSSSEGCVKLRGYSKKLQTAKDQVSRLLVKLNEEIKQQEATKTGSTVRLPSTWKTVSSDAPMKIVGLSSTDHDYALVSNRFNTESNYGYTITKIERIENPSLYSLYRTRKRLMERSGGKANEQTLWHAASETALAGIHSLGFYTSSRIGTTWGVGAVFAPSASTCTYSYCARDIFGQYHVYLAEVLVGDTCQGKQGMTAPPQKLTGGQHDSTTDSLMSPSLYVIYSDSQAYPSYHVVFQ